MVGRWLVALSAAGRLEEAREAAKRIDDKLPATESSLFIALGLGRAGRIDEVRYLLKGLPPEKSDQAATTLVRVLIEANRFEEALTEIQKINGEFARGQELAVLIWAMTEATKLSDAARILSEVGSASMAALLQPANQALAKALVRAGQTAEALVVARKIPAPRLQEAALRSVALELVEIGKVDDALTLAAGFPQRDDRESVWFVAARSLAGSGRLDDAKALVRQLREPPAPTPKGPAAANGTQTRRITALPVARRRPARERWETALNEIALEMAKRGSGEEALAVATELPQPADRDSIRLAAVGSLAALGRYQEATALARKSDDEQQRVIALERVAGALNSANNKEAAVALANEILTEASKLRPDAARAEIMGRLSSGFAAAGLLGPADDALKECINEKARVSALLAIAEALTKAGRYDEALERVLSVPETGQRWKGVSQVVAAAAAAGRPLAGLGALQGMTAHYQVTRIKSLTSAGKPEQALAVARELKERDSDLVPWDNIAVAFARADDFHQARLAADRARSPGLRLAIYTHLLMMLAVKQDPALRASRGNANLLL